MRLRQGRLKTKFWSYYPTVQSGVWHGAVELVRSVLYRHRGPPTFASLTDRPLPKEHFDFRDGDAPRRGQDPEACDRLNDPDLGGHRSEETQIPHRIREIG